MVLGQISRLFGGTVWKANTYGRSENGGGERKEEFELEEKELKAEGPGVELELGGGEGLDDAVKTYTRNIQNLVVVLILLALGIGSAVLAILAEVNNFESDVTINSAGDCVYSSDSFIYLGSSSAVLLSIAFILVNVFGIWSWVKRNVQGFPLAYLIGTWLWFLFSLYYLLSGVAAWETNEDLKNSSPGKCEIVKSGTFAKGSAFAVLVVLTGIRFYYVAAMVEVAPATAIPELLEETDGETGGTHQAASHPYVHLSPED